MEREREWDREKEKGRERIGVFSLSSQLWNRVALMGFLFFIALHISTCVHIRMPIRTHTLCVCMYTHLT